MKTLLAIAALLLLCACGVSRERKQHLADAHAGIEALADSSTLPAAHAVGDRAKAFASLAAGLTATASGAALPPPRVPAPDIAANPAPYLAIPLPSDASTWAAVGGWALAIAGLAAAVVRATGLGGPLLQLGAALLENASQRQRRERLGRLAGLGQTVVETVESLPPEIAAPVKRAVSKRVTPAQEMALRELLPHRPPMPRTSPPRP